MTRKLEELLGLSDTKDFIKEQSRKDRASDREVAQHVSMEETEKVRDILEFNKITSALPQVRGLGTSTDKELDEVADKAMAAYENLMDLGMNVEARYSGRIFEVAGAMLNTHLGARVAKLDKKLKMVDLQLKQQKIDNDTVAPTEGFVEGNGYVVTDRNSLLQRLKGFDKDK